MISFFGGIKFFRFWPKTMDYYSKAFSIRIFNYPVQRISSLTEALGNKVELVDIRLSREERLSSEHLRKETSDCPDVDGTSVACVTNQQLRGTVPSRGNVVCVRFTGGCCGGGEGGRGTGDGGASVIRTVSLTSMPVNLA